MPQFNVDDDLAALVERLAKPKPFENLSFNAALRRILHEHIKPKQVDSETEQMLAQYVALAKGGAKKTPSPSPQQWAANIPELKVKKNLNTWQAVCDLLKI